MHERLIYALGHPCFEAEETAHPQYMDLPAPNLARIVTVNSGFE
ncbi:MAG: hypothetical protein WBG86_14535 [Polyangiales bacterium]